MSSHDEVDNVDLDDIQNGPPEHLWSYIATGH